MYKLYYWPTPNGHKITMFLEEAALPYEIVPLNIFNGDQFKPDFLRISPNNRMPALIDEEAGISIFESGAILLYLAEKHKAFLPEDMPGRVVVLEWLFWQVGGLGPMLGQANHFSKYAKEKIPYAIGRYENEARRLLGVLEKRLDGRVFLAGNDYTIADMASYSWVRTGVSLLPDLVAPRLKEWLGRIEARPATGRAFAIAKEARFQRVPLSDAQWNRLFAQGGKEKS